MIIQPDFGRKGSSMKDAGVACQGSRRSTLQGLGKRLSIALESVARHRMPVLVIAAAVLGILDRNLSPPDSAYFAQAGGRLLSGHLGEVYASDYNQSGPLQLIVSHLFLPGGPSDLTQLIMHVVGNLAVVGVLVGGCRICRRGIGLAPSPSAEMLVGTAAVLWVLPGDFWSGHLAQLTIPCLWFLSAESARRGRLGVAAVLLGLSAGMEPWGVLAVPLLLAETRPRLLLRAACIFGAVVSAIYIPFVLTGNFHMFEHAWPINDGSVVHRFWPHAQEFTWGMRLAQGGVSVLACAAVTLLLKGRIGFVWMAPLAAVLFRLLLDPTMFGYYWVPVCLLALVGAGTIDSSWSRIGAISAMSLAYLPFIKFGSTAQLNLLLTIAALGVCVLTARTGPRGTDQPPALEHPVGRRQAA